MGTSYTLKCEKCGYEFEANEGCGWLFQLFHERIMGDIEAGKYNVAGKNILKEFMEECPDGGIGTEDAVAICNDCGMWEVVPQLTMYIPKDGKHIGYEKMEFIWVLKKYCEEYEKYPHKCKYCGGTAEVMDDFGHMAMRNELYCPKCEGDIKVIEFGRGD